MDDAIRRQIILYMPNKIYAGKIDLQKPDMRTLDLLNSSNIYWKNPNERSFTDAIMLYDGSITVQGNRKLTDFAKLQLRLNDIIFFTDDLVVSGSETEKKRAQTLSQRSGEKATGVKLITRMRGAAFYVVQGVFYGLFKSKSQQRFMPIIKPTVHEFLRTGTKWESARIEINNNFLGLSTAHIESCSIDG